MFQPCNPPPYGTHTRTHTNPPPTCSACTSRPPSPSISTGQRVSGAPAGLVDTRPLPQLLLPLALLPPLLLLPLALLLLLPLLLPELEVVALVAAVAAEAAALAYSSSAASAPRRAVQVGLCVCVRGTRACVF